MKNILILLLVVLGISCASEEQFPDNNKMDKFPYPEEIYGPMFGEIQLMKLYPDSKTFTDAIPKKSINEIKLEFRKRKNDPGFDAKAFVEEHWDIPAPFTSEFEADTAASLTDHINALWPVLTRTDGDAREGSTLIPLPKPYIVPSGDFREMYYWDSYFIMLGLKESGQEEMIKNMLDNFVFLIDEVGHIPNGNRSYFISRSNPPFFAKMVELYAGIKGDEVYKVYLPAMQKEYDFWMRGHDQVSTENPEYEHCVLFDDKVINRYFDSYNAPRQEHYQRDRRFNSEILADMRAATESGWNFSSRWQRSSKYLGSIRTLDLFPVDLNALLYGLEEKLEKAYRISGNNPKADEMKTAMAHRIDLMNNYHWSDSLGVFFDYHFEDDFQLDRYTPAMMYPMFFNMASDAQAAKVVEALKGKLLKQGGVVTSTYETYHRWDAPRGWAPLQWITLVALDNYGYKSEALDLARRWTSLNEKVFQNTGQVMDKYNVQDLSLKDGGAEYDGHYGYGWTNGVYLAMKKYIADNG